MIFRRSTLLVVPRAHSALSTCSRACPRCSSALFGVARRWPDRLLSLFVPLRRYRCISLQCSWEGNFREQRSVLQPQVSNGRAKCPASVFTQV